MLLVKEKPNDPYPVEILIRIEAARAPSRGDDYPLFLVDPQCLLVDAEQLRCDADRVDWLAVGRHLLAHLVSNTYTNTHILYVTHCTSVQTECVLFAIILVLRGLCQVRVSSLLVELVPRLSYNVTTQRKNVMR